MNAVNSKPLMSNIVISELVASIPPPSLLNTGVSDNKKRNAARFAIVFISPQERASLTPLERV